MEQPRNFVEENAVSQQELRALVACLSDDDLMQDMGQGWTVAAFLAHMAFYDFRAAAAVDRWRSDSQIDPFPLDAQLTNAATAKLLQAIPPRSAARLAIEAAEAADSAITSLTDELLMRIAPINQSVNMFRSEHRREHIDQIASALKKK
jgi:hypothetical protein